MSHQRMRDVYAAYIIYYGLIYIFCVTGFHSDCRPAFKLAHFNYFCITSEHLTVFLQTTSRNVIAGPVSTSCVV